MRVFLTITAMVAGALVMTLEVVGARVIGAFYGVSLFVWTSLIAVFTLAFLTFFGVPFISTAAHKGAI